MKAWRRHRVAHKLRTARIRSIGPVEGCVGVQPKIKSSEMLFPQIQVCTVARIAENADQRAFVRTALSRTCDRLVDALPTPLVPSHKRTQAFVRASELADGLARQSELTVSRLVATVVAAHAVTVEDRLHEPRIRKRSRAVNASPNS